jgi:hypothetical protein
LADTRKVMLGHEAKMETEGFGLDVGLDEIEEAFGARRDVERPRCAAAPPNNPKRIGRPKRVCGMASVDRQSPPHYFSCHLKRVEPRKHALCRASAIAREPYVRKDAVGGNRNCAPGRTASTTLI